MNFRGNENLIDDPTMVDGKFVRNIGSHNYPSLYHYVYMKDSDKDLMRRMDLAIRVGASLGTTVGVFHVADFGRNVKWPTKLDPFLRVGFACLNGIVAMMLHSGTVSLASQMQGGQDLVRNWALGGFVAGSYASKVMQKTPRRLLLISHLPIGAAGISSLIKVATVYDKPVTGFRTTEYGMRGVERCLGPRYYDTINPYRRHEEHYLEKYM